LRPLVRWVAVPQQSAAKPPPMPFGLLVAATDPHRLPHAHRPAVANAFRPSGHCYDNVLLCIRAYVCTSPMPFGLLVAATASCSSAWKAPRRYRQCLSAFWSLLPALGKGVENLKPEIANAFRPSGHCDGRVTDAKDWGDSHRQCLSAFWSLRPIALSVLPARHTVSPMPFGLLVTATRVRVDRWRVVTMVANAFRPSGHCDRL